MRREVVTTIAGRRSSRVAFDYTPLGARYMIRSGTQIEQAITHRGSPATLVTTIHLTNITADSATP